MEEEIRRGWRRSRTKGIHSGVGRKISKRLWSRRLVKRGSKRLDISRV